MRILDTSVKQDAAKVLAELTRTPEPDGRVRAVVEKMILEVRRGGDRALVGIHNRFAQKSIRLAELKIRGRFRAPSAEQRKALALAEKNIAEFARRTRPKSWVGRNRQGARTGENFPALGRVGV